MGQKLVRLPGEDSEKKQPEGNQRESGGDIQGVWWWPSCGRRHFREQGLL